MPDADGVTQDISVAAAVLIAGMAAAHDAPDTGTDTDTERGEQRARDFLAFGIETRSPEPGQGPGGSVVAFDALAHTVTTDGDAPRCAECGEYGSHPGCQPEELHAAAAPAAPAMVAGH